MTENELLEANFTLLKKVMVLEEENEWLHEQAVAVIKRISALEEENEQLRDQIEVMVRHDVRTIGLGPPQ